MLIAKLGDTTALWLEAVRRVNSAVAPFVARSACSMVTFGPAPGTLDGSTIRS